MNTKSSDKTAGRRPDGMPVGTPFPKGKSGNPAGRQPGCVSIKAELRKLLQVVIKNEVNPLTMEDEDMPVGRKIALNLILKAVNDKDTWAITRIMEQLDGKPAQSVNLGGQEGENPVVTRGELVVKLISAKVSSDE